MAGKILQIRSLVPGKVPLTSSLLEGEIAINVPDGKAFLRKSGSAGDVITSFVTTDSTTTGSIYISGTVTASQFSGSGADLYDISASAIIGGLITLSTGSVTASVHQTNGFTVTSLLSGSTFSGSINIISGTINMIGSGSGENMFGTASWALNAVNGGGAATIVSASIPPTSSISGTLWFNTTNGNTFIQLADPTGSNWVPATSYMATGSVTASIHQTDGFMVSSPISGSTFTGSISTISGSITVQSASIVVNSGSIYVNNDYTGSNIFGTASWALNALNAGAQTLISASAPPTTSVSGTLWFNTTNGNTYIQLSDPTGSNWVSTNTLMSTGSVTASIDVTKGFLVNSIPSGSIFSGSVQIISGTLSMMDSGSGVTIFATASHAVSASIAYTTVVQAGASKIATVATASLTWSLTHNLGTLYPNVDIYRYDNSIIIPRTIRSVDSNTTEVTFTTPMSGTVVTTVGGGMPPLSSSYANYVLQVDGNGLSAAWKSALTISGSMQYAETASASTGFIVNNGTGSAQFAVYGTSSFFGPVAINSNPINGAYRTNFPSPADTWSINHNLDSTTLMVQTFDLDGTLFFPDQITMTDSNNTLILIGIPKAGYVVVK